MIKLHIDSPLLQSRVMSGILGRPVYLKMDALQPTGSFKIRGIGNACVKAFERGAREYVSSSGGNAGLAVAYAARNLGARARIFMAKNAPTLMRKRIEDEGAEVRTHGEVWDDANRAALLDAAASGACFIPPFDHPDLWEGHASLVDELAASEIKPAAIVVAVGGGGLIAGVFTGLMRRGWTGCLTLAAETKGAASFARAIERGEPVDIERIDSIAHSLGAKRVAAGAVALAQQHTVECWQASDRMAVEAVSRFADDHRVLVEPACGAALAAVYQRAPSLVKGEGPVVVIVCGGAAVTLDMLAQWRSTVSVVE